MLAKKLYRKETKSAFIDDIGLSKCKYFSKSGTRHLYTFLSSSLSLSLPFSLSLSLSL